MKSLIKYFINITILTFLFYTIVNFAFANVNGDIKKSTTENKNPWSVLVYYGKMTDKQLNQVFHFQTDLIDSPLYGLEFDRDLAKTNSVYKFFHYVGAESFVAINTAYEDDERGDIYELNPYFGLRWQEFPWNKYLITSFSIGEGVSYVTRIPEIELRTASQAQYAKKFLNFLSFEAAFALPSYPNFQIVYKIHHRSGCFGLYKSSNSGSTAIALGVRYLF